MSDLDGALCRGLHSEMFFPPLFKEERQDPESQYYWLGKFVCEHCPVIRECAKAGWDEEFGLWGGMTPKDRRNKRYALNKSRIEASSVALFPAADGLPLDLQEAKVAIRPLLKRRKKA
jgi:hypothetical protein